MMRFLLDNVLYSRQVTAYMFIAQRVPSWRSSFRISERIQKRGIMSINIEVLT